MQKPDLLLKSRNAFKNGMLRAKTLGLDYLVTHMGAHTGAGAEAGMARLSKSLDWLHAKLPDVRVRITLETTAGQGTALKSWRVGRFCVGTATPCYVAKMKDVLSK